MGALPCHRTSMESAGELGKRPFEGGDDGPMSKGPMPTALRAPAITGSWISAHYGDVHTTEFFDHKNSARDHFLSLPIH